MFDMNRLFEEYIGQMVREIFPDKPIKLQGPREYVLWDAAKEQGAFMAKPDITCSEEQDKILWIIDTKWKELDSTSDHGVAQADIYQMMAYAHRYDCARIVLLYPHIDRLVQEPGIIKTYSILSKLENRERQIQIASVDLSRHSLNEYVGGQIKKLVN